MTGQPSLFSRNYRRERCRGCVSRRHNRRNDASLADRSNNDAVTHRSETCQKMPHFLPASGHRASPSRQGDSVTTRALLILPKRTKLPKNCPRRNSSSKRRSGRAPCERIEDEDALPEDLADDKFLKKDSRGMRKPDRREFGCNPGTTEVSLFLLGLRKEFFYDICQRISQISLWCRSGGLREKRPNAS